MEGDLANIKKRYEGKVVDLKAAKQNCDSLLAKLKSEYGIKDEVAAYKRLKEIQEELEELNDKYEEKVKEADTTLRKYERAD